MAKKYDDFDEGDQDGVFGQILNIVSNRKREFAIVSVAAAVILLGLVVVGSYPDSEDTAANESVPIVRADAGEYKTTPENPGGMEIPYRDSTVFSSTDGQKADGGTENILADEGSEEPLPREELFAGLNTEGEEAAAPAGQPKGEVEETMAKVDSVEPPANDTLVKEAIGVPADGTTASTTKTASATPPAAAIKEPVKSETVKEETIAKTEPASGTVSAKGITPGGYYVQLASVRSQAGASGEYKKLQAKYAGLSGLNYRTQEANLGAKGTFYRIQAGPMSKDSAASICNGIKAKGGSCLVAGK